ncbi:MAG: tyrosine-protein phosphatase [Acidobacteriota bacterium]
MVQKSISTSVLRDLGLVILLTVLAVSWPGTTVPAQVSGSSANTLRNFGKVNDAYYRGAQPREHEIDQLKRMGIKTIIDLRKDKEPREAEWVSRAGLQYFNIPMLAGRAATEKQVSYFLGLVNDPANGPVYVHCKGGKHRTGALTAAYRITHDKWTADQAFEEMKRYDFNDGFFGGPSGQKRFVYAFYQQYLANRPAK